MGTGQGGAEHGPGGAGEPSRKALYVIGGIAGILASLVFRRNLGAEFFASGGFGVFRVPQAMPSGAGEWFALFQETPFVALVLFGVFDIVEYGLVGLMFFALYDVLKREGRGVALPAMATGLSGIVVYFASNRAFEMLALSRKYGLAVSNEAKDLLRAAGEAMLATGDPGAVVKGGGIYASLFLVLLAGLAFSFVMLKSPSFGRVAAITGILANATCMGYFVMLAAAPVPTALAIPFVVSAPFRIAWYVMISVKLFRLSRTTTSR